jgi:hypothetical protein
MDDIFSCCLMIILFNIQMDGSFSRLSNDHFDHYPMDSKNFNIMWLFDQYLGPNEIKQANGVTLDKDYKSFCPKLVFLCK